MDDGDVASLCLDEVELIFEFKLPFAFGFHF